MPELRLLAFVGVVVALLGALVWTTVDQPPRGLTQARPSAPVRLAPVASALPSPPPIAARHAARRFVEAFLSYEVGGGRAAVAARAIRADADATFAGELISHPPPPTPTDPRPAHVVALRFERLPGDHDLALVSGTARRSSGPEPFAFIFAWREDRWLAVAPGE